MPIANILSIEEKEELVKLYLSGTSMNQLVLTGRLWASVFTQGFLAVSSSNALAMPIVL